MTGYQDRDYEIVDYHLWTHPGTGLSLRGPEPHVLARGQFIACVGAAQTFGCLCERPFPLLLGEHLGMPVLNLGVAGAGPRYFAGRPDVVATINAAALVVIQVMSGRSEDNSEFDSGGREYLTRRSDGLKLGAEPAYAQLIATTRSSRVREIVAETRANWVESTRCLFAAIDVPTILFWFSKRHPHYVSDTSEVHRLFGGFPHLIDRHALDAIKPFASAYVESIGDRGTPQRLTSRFSGEPVTITGRADLDSRVVGANVYYPTPEMHEDGAGVLWPVAAALLGQDRHSARVRRNAVGCPRRLVRGRSDAALSQPSALGSRSLHVFHDVIVSPFTQLMQSPMGGVDHQGGPRWPEWERQTWPRHCRAGSVADHEPEAVAEVATVDVPTAWGGPITRHFGHQVADFSMRLLPTSRAEPDMVIAFATHPRYGMPTLRQVPAYLWSVMDWIGVPRTQVRLITAPTLFRSLAVTAQTEQLGGPGPAAAHLDELDAHTRRRFGTIERTGLLFVSRASETARFAGEAYLEDVLRAAGATILRPLTLPLAEQLRSYASAGRVVFSGGSAVHATQLLGRSLGDIWVLNRVPGVSIARESLEPRATSLTYLDTAVGMVHGLRPNGTAELAVGITIADPDRLVDGLAEALPSIGRYLDAQAFRRAQEQDTLTWLGSLDPRWTEPTGSVDHLLASLPACGMEHLVPAARQLLS